MHLMHQQLKILMLELTHDKKRFGAMCTLVAFGILLWARLIILQNLPKSGFADPGTENVAGKADANATDAANNTEKITSPLAELPITYLDTESALARNFFARLTIESVQTEESPPDTLLTPKSQSKETENSKADELDSREKVEIAAAALRLESVMGGEKPLAVINGEVLAIGQKIDDFTLEAVATGSVILRRGAFRVKLKIKKQGGFHDE